ncbi:sporulation integral membrane protein YtvI [Bacillus sp. DX4.1]|uniref:sporulation integral membrane protein YtvI n=1 Tax=Bacillus sp. DX4.1 TaxID=3055867 RepID=UPI0025A1A019|nr:sporulation integral membrane protein YtvI [Bacillus sp. DX4.1]MDM5190276.1 sporulation integral membrane protein YtvI [Bacillus sp. DX4.1]
MNRNLLYIILRLLFVIAVAIIGFYVLLYVSGLIYPFIIALAFAYLINPVVNFLNQKLQFPRALAVLVGLILVFGAIVGLVTYIVTEVISATTYLLQVVTDKLPAIIQYAQQFALNNIMPLYDDLISKFNHLGESQQYTITQNIQNLGTEATKQMKDLLTAIISGLTYFISALPTTLTVLVFVLLATFFISFDWHTLAHRVKKSLPNRIHGYGKTIFFDLRKALFGFVKAQLTLVSMTTIIVLIGLLILRVPYAITIALITGIVDLLPYLGTGAIFVPWIIYIFFTGDTAFAIGLLILYIVVIVQRQLMEPKVLSSNIGLDPLPTLIALFVGFKLYGFLGLIIGPVTLVLLNTLHKARVFHDLWKFIKG